MRCGWQWGIVKLSLLEDLIIRQLKPQSYDDWQRVGALIEKRQAILESIPIGEFICLDKAIELLSQPKEPELVTRSVGDYRRSIRALVRGLYQEEATTFEFVDQMVGAIRRNMTQAWSSGMAECGLLSDEMTEIEQYALNDKINGQLPYIPGFADAIIQARDAGEKLEPLFRRADLWVNQYEGARVIAAAMACGDKKKIWTLGNRKEHCQTCKGLSGKVKRYSFWLAHVLPRNFPNGKLECTGARCACSLDDTSLPISRGPLPFGL